LRKSGKLEGEGKELQRKREREKGEKDGKGNA